MKPEIHPKYPDVEARCACGATWKTRSTKPELHLEICSNCHPFFTGRQKLIDTEGRVERFTKKFGAQTVGEPQEGREGPKGKKEAAARKSPGAASSICTRGSDLAVRRSFRQFPIQAPGGDAGVLRQAGRPQAIQASANAVRPIRSRTRCSK